MMVEIPPSVLGYQNWGGAEMNVLSEADAVFRCSVELRRKMQWRNERSGK